MYRIRWGLRIPSSYYSSAIRESKIPTDCFQRSLPTLSVPELGLTLSRYINSQKAFLEPDELKKTEKYASSFGTGRGVELQNTLQAFAHANSATSYLKSMWSDVYMCDRNPVVFNSNPLFMFNDSKLGEGYQHPVIRATNLVYSMLRFCRLLRAKNLLPELIDSKTKHSQTLLFQQLVRWVPSAFTTPVANWFKTTPLDMSAYEFMFGSTRLPRPGRDETFVDPASRHLLVIRQGQQYVFDVFNDHGNPISGAQLLANIKFILEQPKVSNGSPGVGSITAMNREDAFLARQRLLELGNADSLNAVDSSLFALVLDDEDHQSDICRVTSNLLGGPSESRWFDKSISLLIDPTGRAAINFEHSWGDGVAVMRLFNDVYHDSEADPVVKPSDVHGSSSLPRPTVRRLEWLLDDHFLSNMLLPGRRAYDEKRDSLQFSLSEPQNNAGLSKKLCKHAGVSPDAMMQLAFQLANDLVHGKPAATYESCSTAAFKHGRTETLRSATPETRRFVELMRRQQQRSGAPISGGNPANPVDDGELIEALLACSTRHGKLAKEATMGQGWDRHLFALKNFALAETGQTLPELFSDENYRRINQIVLSTSTVQSPVLRMFSFGPVIADGYGMGYLIHDAGYRLMVTSWSEAPNARATQLRDAFEQSINHLSRLLGAVKQRKQDNN